MPGSPNDTPRWVRAMMDTALSVAERLVLIALAWHQGSNGSAWPSQATLADELGLSERTIRRLICGLIEKGRVRISRPANQGRGQANAYVVFPGLEEGQTQPQSGDTKADIPDTLLGSKGGQDCPPSEGQKADVPDRLSGKKEDKIGRKGGHGCPPNTKEHKRYYVCTERISFDLSAGRFVGVSDGRKSDWAEASPGVNIDRELIRAAIWWRDNPAKRKKNIARFLTNWMSRASRGFDRPSGGRSDQPLPDTVVPAIARGPDGLTPRERLLRQEQLAKEGVA